jgi:hypothetical protein
MRAAPGQGGESVGGSRAVQIGDSSSWLLRLSSGLVNFAKRGAPTGRQLRSPAKSASDLVTYVLTGW